MTNITYCHTMQRVMNERFLYIFSHTFFVLKLFFCVYGTIIVPLIKKKKDFAFTAINKKKLITDSPLSTIFPNKFLPNKKFLVEQFHRRFRNWCWHSDIAKFAPLTSADKTPGFSRTRRRCFRRNVLCIAGSIYIIPDVSGEILLGSPTFAIPLKIENRQKNRS